MEHDNKVEDKKFFSGKVVLLYLLNPPDEFVSGIPISNPEIKELNGRSYFVGRIPKNPNDWASELRTGIAVDQIAHFIEFDDEEEFIMKSSSVDKWGKA
jgi:hypothetical protein